MAAIVVCSLVMSALFGMNGVWAAFPEMCIRDSLCRVFKKETGQSPAQWRALAGHTAQSGLSPEEALREQELYI